MKNTYIDGTLLIPDDPTMLINLWKKPGLNWIQRKAVVASVPHGTKCKTTKWSKKFNMYFVEIVDSDKKGWVSKLLFKRDK